MKILVVSDSHRRLDNLVKAYEKENPDIVICGGDYDIDGEELSFIYPDSKYIIVSGNCDYFYSNYPNELKVVIENFKFFVTHGNIYRVKSEYDFIYKKGEELGCDIVIFGHTHRQYLDTTKKVKLFNPGAMIDGEYGIITIEDNKMEFFHKSL